MTQSGPKASLRTHDVVNQPDPLWRANLWRDDPVLRAAAARLGAQESVLDAYGAALGGPEMAELARDANRFSPEMRLFDSGGRRLDEVTYHPAYHRFMELSARAGYAAVAWEGGARGHATHAAMVYLASQVEPGHCCPLTMTYAAVPVIAEAADLAPLWHERLLARDYDPRVRPVGAKRAATLGMAMTEKQGGSDVRANTTRAEPDGAAWRLTGHKWFCSAPMSDGFLTLAQAPEGISCFLVPRWLEDGRNGIRLMRLKDKLGNRSNASAEIEFDRALAYAVGPPGEGVRTIIEMVHHTRLDTAMAPVGLMRAALVRALHWARHRSAFRKQLIDQPLMRAVLADLAMDWEGALALSMHVAGHFDRRDDAARSFARVGVALAKFLANKLCPGVVVEAMETLGGMGYVEDTGLPLLYREAPLNGIWEGSGNVICLDILRTLARDPLAGDALEAELAAAAGQCAAYDRALAEHRARWRGGVPEPEARWFAESTALLLSASVLLLQAPTEVAESFVATRLTGPRGRIAGSVSGLDTTSILSRISPET